MLDVRNGSRAAPNVCNGRILDIRGVAEPMTAFGSCDRSSSRPGWALSSRSSNGRNGSKAATTLMATLGGKRTLALGAPDLLDLVGDARCEAFGLKLIELRETRCGPKVRHPEAQAFYGSS